MNEPLPLVETEADFRARFTTREFMEMSATGAFDGMRVELVDGALERMTPPLSEHGRLQLDIGFALRGLFRKDLLVTTYTEVGIDLGDNTIVVADAILARRSDHENRLLEPDEVFLAVEVASTTLSRDLGTKRRLYARAGIPNYWVVDVERRVVHRFAEPANGEYLALAPLRFGEPVPVPGADGTIVLD